MKILTIDNNLSLTIHNTLKNLTQTVTLKDYEQYRNQALLYAPKIDFIELADTDNLDTNATRLMAMFLYSDYKKQCRFSWDHYHMFKPEKSYLDKQNRIDEYEHNSTYREICHILQDPAEPYSADLRAHASDLRSYLHAYLQGTYHYQENRTSQCRKVDKICRPYRDSSNHYCQSYDKTFTYADESIIDLIRTYQSVRWLKENMPSEAIPKRGYTCVYFSNEEDAKKYASEYIPGSVSVEVNEYMPGHHNFCVTIDLDFDNNVMFECSYEALEYKMSKDNDSDYMESDSILD